eukprot:Skav211022  [mRNA]  locus=scaffold610:113196:116585:- [translate_table: standard]
MTSWSAAQRVATEWGEELLSNDPERCFADLNRARSAYHAGLECSFEWEVLSTATGSTGSDEQLRVLGQVLRQRDAQIPEVTVVIHLSFRGTVGGPEQ